MNKADNESVLSAVKRAKNILDKEEKASGKIKGKVNEKYFTSEDETALYNIITQNADEIISLANSRDYNSALAQLNIFEQPLNNYLDNVTINADDANVRANRYKILASVRDIFEAVAL